MPSRKPRRPPEVTLIALFHFLKAFSLLEVSYLSFARPDLLAANPLLVSIIIYVAAHGRNPRGFLIPIYALSVASMGFGLWRLRKWSRYAVMLSAAVTAGMLVYTLRLQETGNGIQQGSFFDNLRGPTNTTAFIVIAIDIFIICYLIAYPDISHAFKDRR